MAPSWPWPFGGTGDGGWGPAAVPAPPPIDSAAFAKQDLNIDLGALKQQASEAYAGVQERHDEARGWLGSLVSKYHEVGERVHTTEIGVTDYFKLWTAYDKWHNWADAHVWHQKNKFYRYQARLWWNAPGIRDLYLPRPMQQDTWLPTLLAAVQTAQVARDHLLFPADAQHAWVAGRKTVCRWPFVTWSLLGANLAVFGLPGGLPFRAVCLSPYCVLAEREWYRLATHAFVHTHVGHLLANLSGMIPTVAMLEAEEGHLSAALDVTAVTLLGGLLHVGSAWAELRFLRNSAMYYSSGGIGFSGAVYGLQMLTGLRHHATMHVLGFEMPAEYAAWVSMALTQFLTPHVSFHGHICGLAAGVVVYVLGKHVGGWKHAISRCWGAAEARGKLRSSLPRSTEPLKPVLVQAAIAVAAVVAFHALKDADVQAQLQDTLRRLIHQ